MTARPQRILCLASAASEAGVAARRDVVGRLRAAGFDVVEGPRDPNDVELMIILGGDGFLMESLQALDYPPTPVFGVNYGTVGFHMNPKSCLEDLVGILSAGTFLRDSCPVLEAEIETEDGARRKCRAFNDVFIERQSRQSIRFGVSVDGTFFNRLAGDGIVIATAVGSTAYNLAAGGPAVHPRVEGLVLSPLYPHRAAPFHSLQFPLLLPLDSEITIEAEDLPKRRMRLVADGQPVEAVARVTIRDSGRRITLLRTPENRYLETLAKKFMGR